MSDMILDFHIFVEGDLTKSGLLLADLAPSPRMGDVLPMEMTRSLLKCYSGTVCSFPNILRCLKRFIYEHDSEERLISVITRHLLPSQSRPELPGPTDPPPRHKLDISFSSPTCSPWRETLREWLIDCEAFEAVPQIEFPWGGPDSSNPGKSWAALLDFFHALQGNVTNWIRKMEHNGMNTLAAHGEDLFGSKGVKTSIRVELRLDLKLNKDAWKALSGQEQEDWVSHLMITGSQQRRLSNPRIISWNAGPHGYRNSRDEIWSIFAQGQPLICPQDLQIPPKLIPAIKDELHAQFPHYWIFVSTVNKQGVTCDSSGEHYNFTTLTALDSYHFPSATSETLHAGLVSGRALALSTTTKSGGKFVIINLYQFMAANPVEQQEVWDIIAAWVLKHTNDKIILIGHLNSAPAGEQTGYSLPLSNSLRQTDARLRDFCEDTGDDLTSSRCHSWRRGKQSASLDNAVTWNYPLSQPQICPFEAKHKRYDHGVLSFALPCEDFITSLKVPERSFDIPTDRVDVVFFQRNLLQWHKNVQQRISPFSSEGGEATGELLLQQMREEQDIMRREALKLQVRAETSRRRARERRPNRSKEQVLIRRLHATLAEEYSEALTATADSRVTVATRVGLKALGLDHLLEAILRHVQISPNRAYLLRAEVKKVQAQLLKLDEAHLREGKQKRCDLKKYIFDHGIKGVRRV